MFRIARYSSTSADKVSAANLKIAQFRSYKIIRSADACQMKIAVKTYGYGDAGLFREMPLRRLSSPMAAAAGAHYGSGFRGVGAVRLVNNQWRDNLSTRLTTL